MHWDTYLILVPFQPMLQNHAENLIKLRTRKKQTFLSNLETDIHAFVLFCLDESNAQLNKILITLNKTTDLTCCSNNYN